MSFKNSSKINSLSSFCPTCFFLTILFFTLIFFFCCSKPALGNGPAEKWVGTWVTAPQLVEPGNMPPQPGLRNNTLRQIMRVSIGGDTLRIRFSNEFSKSPVTIQSVHIALSTGLGGIDPNTDTALKFNGEPAVTMPALGAVISDPLGFTLKPRTDYVVTIYFGDTSPDVTGHPGSRTTSFLVIGNHVTEAKFDTAAATDHWYVINAIDVKAPESAAAVVVLGNSITDGRGSGTNKQNRWPDILAERLQKDPDTKNIAVLNQGIGGNCVLRNCLGPAAIDRFQRDVLDQDGVKWLIILEGVNDIGQAQGADGSDKVAKDLIEAFEKMIKKAHAKNIKVYGATILPFKPSFYYTEDHERARKTVNDWIRNSGKFDAVIDLEKAVQDPANPMSMLPSADTGDHLHPNEAGHKMMGEAVDLGLFK